VARILKDALGGNYFAARYGGDEFCIILEDCDTKRLDEIVDSINSCVNEFNRISNFEYNIGLSMGYSVYDGIKQKPEEFFDQIDRLMYRNKRSHA
jgi:diguanylate cyclase (GGDEF)-like protein